MPYSFRLTDLYFDIIRNIEYLSSNEKVRELQLPKAVEALFALAHASRLAVFRFLVRAGEEGVAAGEIARVVGVLPNTLSTHLTILGHAGLIRSRRDGRSVIYSADYDGMRDLLAFLVADCCDGHPEICASLSDVALGCCPPK